MHKSIQLGNRFETGKLQFEIMEIEFVREYSSNVYVRILDSGYFCNDLIKFTSEDIGAGILSGEILLIDKRNINE